MTSGRPEPPRDPLSPSALSTQPLPRCPGRSNGTRRGRPRPPVVPPGSPRGHGPGAAPSSLSRTPGMGIPDGAGRSWAAAAPPKFRVTPGSEPLRPRGRRSRRESRRESRPAPRCPPPGPGTAEPGPPHPTPGMSLGAAPEIPGPPLSRRSRIPLAFVHLDEPQNPRGPGGLRGRAVATLLSSLFFLYFHIYYSTFVADPRQIQGQIHKGKGFFFF